jgi:hypothetical protein
MTCSAGAGVPIVQLTLSDDGAGVTVTVGAGAAETFTCTGMETATPVPARLTLPVYVPAVLNEAVLKVMDKLAGFDSLTLKLAAESPIHDWLALAVNATGDADAVLN